MRIGLEGSFLAAPTTGSGQYVQALWHEFTARDHGFEPVLLLPANPGGEAPPAANGAARRVAPPARLTNGKARKLWWEQVGLARAAREAAVDLVHVPYFAALPHPDRPYVMTIHDVVPLVLPVYARSRAMRLYLALASRLARRAALVLTDSQHSARDIEQRLRLPRARLRVIPLAAGRECRPLPPDDPMVAAVRAKFGLTGPFVCNIGGLDTRKNLVTLVRAFARALPALPSETRLVIGGAAHSGQPAVYPDLTPVVAATGLGERVIFTGRVGEDEKVALLNAAELSVFPSLYEGFGLPPLEAMRCGTPVLCSNRASLPEVVGDGGLLVEPEEEALAAALARVLNSPAERAALRRRALARAARFSWERTAAATAEAYRAVLAAGRRPLGAVAR